MNNEETILAIRSATQKILDKHENQKLQETFKIGQLQVHQDKIFLNDQEIEGTPKIKIFNILKVKKNFSDYAKSMVSNDWIEVFSKLCKSQSETLLIAQYDESGKIINVYPKNINKKHPDNLRLRLYIDMICKELSQTSKIFKLNHLNYIPEKQKFDLSLLNPEIEIDIFKNGLDVWHPGQSLTFNEIGFSRLPFFERLSCSNGARTREYSFSANILQNRFNIAKISDEIRKAINSDNQQYISIIQDAAQHLKNNNASIAEFENFRDFFVKRAGKKPEYNKIIKNFFDDQPLYQAYGVNIAEKSKKWKSTANSGINAYDLFNQVTWIASHEKETSITPSDAIDLQIAASNFLFKKILDLEDVATPVNLVYPRNPVMA